MEKNQTNVSISELASTITCWSLKDSAGTIVALIEIYDLQTDTPLGNIKIAGDILDEEISAETSGFKWSYTGQNGLVAVIDASNSLVLNGQIPSSSPTALTAYSRTEHRIDIHWDAPSMSVDGYKVFYSIDGTNYEELADVSNGDCFLRHNNLEKGQSYSYYVRAYNGFGESEDSESVYATTLSGAAYSETWDELTTYSEVLDAASSGQMSGADNTWNWMTESEYVEGGGYRETDFGKETGRFESSTSDGSLFMSSPGAGISLEVAENVKTCFEISPDLFASSDDGMIRFEIRSETDYSNRNAGSSIQIDLDSNGDNPFVTIKAVDDGDVSNIVESEETMTVAGGAGRYWVNVEFEPSAATLDISYSIYDVNNPATPAVIGFGNLNCLPRDQLDVLQLEMGNMAVGAIDDIEIWTDWAEEVGDRLGALPECSVAVSSTAESGFTSNVIYSKAANSWFGHSTAPLGDFNGDGYSDVVVGAPWEEFSYEDNESEEGANWDMNSGGAYLVLGPISESSSTVYKLKLAEPDKTTIHFPAYALGYSVSGMGDINGDGYDEMLLGAPWASGKIRAWQEDESIGESYLVYGRSDLSGDGLSLDESNHIIFRGINENEMFGQSVAGIGDFDGDGYNDIAIGAPGEDTNGNQRSGKVYIISGAKIEEARTYLIDGELTDDGIIDLSLNSMAKYALVIENDVAFESFGYSVMPAGDINGDALDDLLIGAPGVNSSTGAAETGAVYIVYGYSGFSDDLGDQIDLKTTVEAYANDTTSLPPVESIAGMAEGSRTGHAIAPAGDVNGDGYSDVLIGAPCAAFDSSETDVEMTQAGIIYLLTGSASGLNCTSIEGAESCEGPCDYALFGSALSGVGDINGDGNGDFVVGAPGYTVSGEKTGGAWVFTSSSGLSLDAATEISSDEVGKFGWNVSPGGDINATLDGYDDYIIGAPNEYNDDESIDENEGAIYVNTADDYSDADPTYRRFIQTGDTGLVAIGQIRNTLPASRCWVQYQGGTVAGKSVSECEVQVIHETPNIFELGDDIGSNYWRIGHCDRTDWDYALIRIHYIESELNDVDADHLAVFVSKDGASSSWLLTPSYIDEARRDVYILVTDDVMSSDGDQYIALVESEIVLASTSGGGSIYLEWTDYQDLYGDDVDVTYAVYRYNSETGDYELVAECSTNYYTVSGGESGYYYVSIKINDGESYVGAIPVTVNGTDSCLSIHPCGWMNN